MNVKNRPGLHRLLTAVLLVPALVLAGLVATAGSASAAVTRCSAWEGAASSGLEIMKVRTCVTLTRPTGSSVRITTKTYLSYSYGDARKIAAKTSTRKGSGAYTSVYRQDMRTPEGRTGTKLLGTSSKIYSGAHGRAEGKSFVTLQWRYAGTGSNSWTFWKVTTSRSFRY